MYLVKVIVHSVLHARSGKCRQLLHLEKWPYMEIIIGAEAQKEMWWRPEHVTWSEERQRKIAGDA